MLNKKFFYIEVKIKVTIVLKNWFIEKEKIKGKK